MKSGIALVAVALVAFAGGYLLAQNTTPNTAVLEQFAAIQKDLEEIKKAKPAAAPAKRRGPDRNKVYKVPTDGSPSKGPENAKVTIVEFSDFQCPFCSRVTPTLDRLRKEYPTDVRVVYKHLPLSFHKDALPAAKASNAAGKQGKFWEMHDLLFKNQRALKEDNFKAYAEELGLDMAKFMEDYKSPKVAAEVTKDMNDARKLGVTGTPGFFINGRFLSGALPYEQFKQRVDEELKKG